MKMFHLVMLAWVCTWPLGAQAQWQWTDKDGRKVFSDLAPPPDIPQKSILQQPGGRRAKSIAETPAPLEAATAAPGTATAASAAAAPAAQGSGSPAAGADKELQQRKAQLEAQEEARKKTEDAKNAAVRTDNCSRAQRAKGTYESARTLRHTNAQGEMVFMDEAARALELRRIQSVIETDCRPRP